MTPPPAPFHRRHMLRARESMMCGPMILVLACLGGAEPGPAMATATVAKVEGEEDVYTYRDANNGGGPVGCAWRRAAGRNRGAQGGQKLNLAGKPSVGPPANVRTNGPCGMTSDGPNVRNLHRQMRTLSPAICPRRRRAFPGLALPREALPRSSTVTPCGSHSSPSAEARHRSATGRMGQIVH